MKNETWKEIPGYEGLYIISNYGRCKRIAPRRNGRPLPDKILKQSKAGWQGKYLSYNLSDEFGKVKVAYVHRAVIMTFLGPPPTYTHQVNHIDGDKHNNHIDNLEWATPTENQQHRYTVLGQSQTGEDNPANKYSEKLVRRVLDMYSEKKYTQRYIAEVTGIDYRYVNSIVLGRAWSHLST